MSVDMFAPIREAASKKSEVDYRGVAVRAG
jgi:hypothetical protein